MGYTFLSIHDIICLTGRKASATAGSLCFYPVWQRRTEGSEHDRMNEGNFAMFSDLHSSNRKSSCICQAKML